MTAPLILWGMPSPNVIKVVLMIEECGLECELRHVGVFTGEQFAPEFRARSPLAKVPVLEDPRLGRPLVESGAILLWLAEREGRFLPAAQPARAEVMQWLMIQIANVGPMLGQVNHFNVVPPDSEHYARARYRAIAARLYRALDDRLAAEEWLAGGDYSIADMATHPWAHYLERHGFDSADFPALLRWRTAIDDRPATRRAKARVENEFLEKSNRSRQAATADDIDRFFNRTDEVPAVNYYGKTQ